MDQKSHSTFLSIHLFLPDCTLSTDLQKALVKAICGDLSQMIRSYDATIISEEQSPLFIQFTENSHSSLLNAIQGSLYLLHRLAEFRSTRDSLERPQWSLQFGMATSADSNLSMETSHQRALQIASDLSRFALKDQIVIDHLSFLTIQKDLLDPWSLKEMETDYAETSQILYHQKSPELQLPQDLQKKSYQLSSPTIAKEDSPCFYYIGLIPSPLESTYLPVLRIYSQKPLPVEETIEESKSSPQSDSVTLGRYTLETVLGVGGMGQVWRARDRFGNAAALKMMLPGNASAEGQIERFRREAEIMSKLPHHNICRIFEVGEAQGVSYIAMELVEGLTLHELLHLPISEQESKSSATLTSLLRQIQSERMRLKQAGEKPKATTRFLSVEMTLPIIGKMCDAIQFAHDHNILHRDIKPGNIMIREDGEPVVMDFGLGKLDNDEKGKDLSLTMEGAMLGTMQYMSPEQAMSSHTVDSRADVYSLGAILFEMLTGKHHFAVSGSLLQDAQKLQDYQPPSLSSYVNTIEKDLEMVVLKALHPEPDRRYRTPAALRADLDRYLHGEAVTAKPVTFFDVIRRMYRRNKPVTIVSLAAIVALLGSGIYSYVQVISALDAKTISEEKEKEKTIEALEAKKIAEEQKIAAQEAKKIAEQKTNEAEEAKKIAEQRLSDLTKALEEKETAENKKNEAEALAKKAESDADLNEQIIAKQGEKYENLLKEKELLAAEFKKNSQKKTEVDKKMTEEQISLMLATELPKIKKEICNSSSFDPMFNLRIARFLTPIAATAPKYLEPSLLLGKLYFSNGNFSEAFGYFIPTIEKLENFKDSTIQAPLARNFFSLLETYIKVDRDFFDETKGTVEIDHRAFVESWKTHSEEDAIFAKRFADPSNKLNEQDRIAFVKFFSLLEKKSGI